MIDNNNKANVVLQLIPFEEWVALPETAIYEVAAKLAGSDSWIAACLEEGLEDHVNAVSLVSVEGQLYKLTGKERKYFWDENPNLKPDALMARVYEISVANMLALENKLKTTSKGYQASDKDFKRIFAELGLTFTSARITGGGLIEPFYLALRGRTRGRQNQAFSEHKELINLKKAVSVFSAELALIDRLNPKENIFYKEILAAALVMLAINEPNDHVLEFLRQLNLNQDLEERQKQDGRLDPVGILKKSIDDIRAAKYLAPSASLILFQKCIDAINLWKLGETSPKYWRTQVIKGSNVNIAAYIKKLRAVKNIEHENDL